LTPSSLSPYYLHILFFRKRTNYENANSQQQSTQQIHSPYTDKTIGTLYLKQLIHVAQVAASSLVYSGVSIVSSHQQDNRAKIATLQVVKKWVGIRSRIPHHLRRLTAC